MIYCVKLRQKRLRGKLDVFPFDRFYLVPKKDRALADRMFRYFFYMDLTDDTLDVLQRYTYSEVRLIPAQGRPVSANGVASELRPIYAALGNEPYLIIVPTYPQRTRKTPDATEENIPATPAYYMSKAVHDRDNPQLVLPQIGIHTPKRDVPLLCAVCKNYPAYTENECSPGRGTCHKNINIGINMGVTP